MEYSARAGEFASGMELDLGYLGESSMLYDFGVKSAEIEENPDILHESFRGMKRISTLKEESDIESGDVYNDPLSGAEQDYAPEAGGEEEPGLPEETEEEPADLF